MNTPVTLLFPTYAEGDPKAGQPIRQGDTVYFYDRYTHELGDSAKVSFFEIVDPDSPTPSVRLLSAAESVPEFSVIPGGPYFSSYAALGIGDEPS